MSCLRQLSNRLLLKVFWGRASPSERSFVERTEVLGEATEEGYELQIDVTAQLQWSKWLPSRAAHAARHMVRWRLEHLLPCLSGAEYLEFRNRLAKYSCRSQSRLSLQSAEQLLESAFDMPVATSYPDLSFVPINTYPTKACGSRWEVEVEAGSISRLTATWCTLRLDVRKVLPFLFKPWTTVRR